MMLIIIILFIGKIDNDIFSRKQTKNIYIKNEKNNFKDLITNNNKISFWKQHPYQL